MTSPAGLTERIAESARAAGRPVVVGVSEYGGSGKSTLPRHLAANLLSHRALHERNARRTRRVAEAEVMAVSGSAWRWGVAAVVVLLVVTGCGDDEPRPLATEACPAPTSSTADGVGSAAVSATGEYRGDLPRGSDGRLVVSLDDGRGSPATIVSPCQRAQLELDLSPAAVTVSPGRFTVTSTEGSGQLSFVDQETVLDEYAAAGYAAGSYAQLTGWYVTVDDPEPGEYVLVRDVAWSQQLSEREGDRRAAGTVTVTLTIT